MSLNSKYCDAFLAVAETQSFEAAAKVLNLTASAVTLRVQSLEKSLGQVLILRERPCKVTHTGQMLMEYLQSQRLREQQLLQQFHGLDTDEFSVLHIATNADSLATWLLPTLSKLLLQEKISLKFQVADQSQTHMLLETGKVSACISSQSQAMKGCQTQLIGAMTYRMVATPDFIQRWFNHGLHRESLRKAPAIIYNDQDQLHSEILLTHFGLTQQSYPFHYIPSSTAFAEAIFAGLGYGLVPDYQIADRIQRNTLVEILPECRTDVKLYWHHWKQQSPALQQLTTVILEQAKQHLNHPISS
ncbi:LysR family transcriptional regulator ArgP [Acinetobacter thermotolerans]|uniref:LysR family transcriptional regulator ArgP n=1 Tax=Acinetobacter thermotolerans TaxID=3151487 RepID=UPI00325A8F80